MRKICIAMIALLWSVQVSHAQAERQMVWDLVVGLDQALVNKDSIRLRNLLTDDFIGAVPTGQAYDKELYIKFHCKPNVGLVSIGEARQDAARIRFYGHTAIVNRRVEVKRKSPDGTTKSFAVQRIEVCVLLNGTWKLAAGQGTEVAQP